MSIMSPGDRAVLWRAAIMSGSEDRDTMLKVLAREVLDSVGRRFDLYGHYEDELIEAVALLDESGLLGRDDLREAFEEADKDEEHARTFLALFADHLRQAGELERLGVDRRLRAIELAGTWRKHLLERPPEDGDWLTVAEVAARYEVTPQAVYKWIGRGRVQSHRTPGGSIRLPASQFERAGRVDRRRLAALQRKLMQRHGDVPAVGDEELAEEVVARRRD